MKPDGGGGKNAGDKESKKEGRSVKKEI